MPHWTNRSIFFGVFFVFITIMVLWLFWPYLNTVLFSITIVVLLSPIYNFFQKLSWVKDRVLPTALTIITFFFFFFAIPVTLLLTFTWYQGKELVTDISRGVTAGISTEEFVLEDFVQYHPASPANSRPGRF